MSNLNQAENVCHSKGYIRIRHANKFDNLELDVYCGIVLNCILLFATPWTVAHQGPLSMEFSRQDYWSGLPFPTPGHFLIQGSNPHLLSLLHWQVDSLPLSHLGSSTMGLLLSSSFCSSYDFLLWFPAVIDYSPCLSPVLFYLSFSHLPYCLLFLLLYPTFITGRCIQLITGEL